MLQNPTGCVVYIGICSRVSAIETVFQKRQTSLYKKTARIKEPLLTHIKASDSFRILGMIFFFELLYSEISLIRHTLIIDLGEKDKLTYY